MHFPLNTRQICAVLAALLVSPAWALDFSLSYLGQQIVPNGYRFSATSVGGLSSLDYIAATGRYLAISDDRGNVNPARFYELSLDLSRFLRSAAPGMAGVRFHAVTTLQQPGGGTFAANTVDPEGMRYDAARDRIYWSSEGQRGRVPFQDPTVREMKPDGSPVREFPVPAHYLPSGSAAGDSPGDLGILDNLAFESLAISSDGKLLYTATENGLAQESKPPSLRSGSGSRILSFDITPGRAGAEYLYEVDPVVPFTPIHLTGVNGLTDFIAVGDRQFITVERAYSGGLGGNGLPSSRNNIRLYHADARGATDISGLDSIAGQQAVPVTKSLLLDLSTLRQDDGTPLVPDNIEGIALGPILDGKRTLVLVSDNNFSNTQFTQFIALQIHPSP